MSERLCELICDIHAMHIYFAAVHLQFVHDNFVKQANVGSPQMCHGNILVKHRFATPQMVENASLLYIQGINASRHQAGKTQILSLGYGKRCSYTQQTIKGVLYKNIVHFYYKIVILYLGLCMEMFVTFNICGKKELKYTNGWNHAGWYFYI